jgi:DNA primase
MNCEQANQIDLIDYLYSLGYQAQKIRNADYWYLSPLRDEKEASFKVNRNKNVWYDHGLGKGGDVIEFAVQFFNCDVSKALQKIFSFQQQKKLPDPAKRILVHNQQNSLISSVDSPSETAIKIVATKQPITDFFLSSYLKKRKINQSVANRHCSEVSFELNNKIYKAIGFKNAAGGYELRNEFFKGSLSPKYVSYFDREKAKSITVFEGFFDFLSYQTIHQNQEQALTNFLVLNSLAFFERSLLLMEKHDKIHLYLDHDEAGRKCTLLAQKRSKKFHDESKLYKGYKDLNEWMMDIGKVKRLRQPKGLRL